VGELRPGMRRVTFERMRDVCTKHRRVRRWDTLYLSWQLLDLYVLRAGKTIAKRMMQAHACVTMAIASKVFDKVPLEYHDLAYWSANIYTQDYLVRTELDVINVLGANIIMPSLYSYYVHSGNALNPPQQAFMDAYLRDDVYARPLSETTHRNLRTT